MTLIGKYIKLDLEYIKKYGPKTMLLMQCGSFFEVYSCQKDGEFTNNRILEFSKICDMRIANKRAKHKGFSVFMSGFPEIQLEKYVKKLNETGYTVPVWRQDPTNPTIRKEFGIFSPGTNFDMNSNLLSNKIMTVWIELYEKTTINKNPRISCGISCIDIVSGDVFTFENIEEYFHNPTTFDELERFYCSYRPNELVLIHNCSNTVINDIISFADIDSSLIHLISMNDVTNHWYTSITNCQKQTYQEAELQKYYEITDYDVFYDSHRLHERVFSTRALTFLLNFLDFHNHDLVKQLKEPVFTNMDNRLRLGNHSLKQLNIISNGRKGKLSSLESLVNKCKTSMGKRHLKHKILNPTTDITYLNKEYSIQEHVLRNFDWKSPFDILGKITDFEHLFRKIILQKVTPSDIAMLCDNLNDILKIYQLTELDTTLSGYLSFPNLSKNIKTIQTKIINFINVANASTITGYDFETNIFKRGCNGEKYKRLDNSEYEYEDKMKKLEIIRKTLSSLITENRGKITEKIRIHQTDKSGLFLITTKTRFKKLCTHKMKKCMVSYECFENKQSFELNWDDLKSSTATGSNVRLDNAILTPLYGQILQNKSNLKEVLMSVYRDYVQSFLENKNEFHNIINYIVKLDFLLARVKVASKYNYCKPTINASSSQSFINAKDMRHPLIEYLQEKEIYVPNNVNLGVKDEHTGILLFGTNAVGKSSLIRSIGMCVVLAQSGFYVPCSHFSFKPYSSIFTRILGNDDIFKGLSTFAVEMSELTNILKNADKNSLVLGDELCSGTETTSAICIVKAGLIWLHKRDVSFIFATHFHELTDNQEISELKRLSMKHMVVEYDESTGDLIYNRKLQNGSGTRLYGLEVCKSLSMPKEFLHMANNFRCKKLPKNNIILSGKLTKYNTKKIKSACELCGEKAEEIHHMAPQKMSDKEGFIKTFHKNHKANLMSICNKCHVKVTKDSTIHRKIKTSTGYRFTEINL
jgi:DNA mismatch repair protein MutS